MNCTFIGNSVMVKTHRHCPQEGCEFSGSIATNLFFEHNHCPLAGCNFIGGVKALKDHIHCPYPTCTYIGSAEDDNTRFLSLDTTPAGNSGFGQHTHCEHCDFVGSNEELLEHYQTDIEGHAKVNDESFHIFLRNKKSGIESLPDYTSINLADMNYNLEDLKQHLSLFYDNFASKLELELLDRVISPLLNTLYPYQLDSLEFRRSKISQYLDICKYVDFKQMFYKNCTDIEATMNQYGYISEEELSQQLFSLPIDLMMALLLMKLFYTRIKYFLCPECKYHDTESLPKHPNIETMLTCTYTGDLDIIIEYLQFRITTKPVRVDPGVDPIILEAPDLPPAKYFCDICNYSTNRKEVFRSHKHCTHWR